MKHTVKSITPFGIFVITLFFTAPPARAEVMFRGAPYEFTLSAGTGFFYGTSYEIVYNAAGSDDYVSELQWNIKPLLFLSIDLEFAPKHQQERGGFFAILGLKAGLPMETGVIEDRDWLSDSPYHHTVSGSLTLFSSHENHTKAAFIARLTAGYSLPAWNVLLKFYGTVDYMYFSWEARNGYVQYGPNDHQDNEYYPYVPWDSGFPKDDSRTRGLGISYVQHWFLFTTGLGARLPLGRFTVSADVFLGLPVCIAIDDHHKRKPPFRTIGVLTKGFAVKPRLGASFLLSERFALALSAAYMYIGETRGNTYTREEGDEQTYLQPDGEGARFKAFEGSLTLIYRL